MAIFIREPASVRSALLAWTSASIEPRAANLFGAETNGSPTRSASRAAAAVANPGGALRPVPTAVPPSASS